MSHDADPISRRTVLGGLAAAATPLPSTTTATTTATTDDDRPEISPDYHPQPATRNTMVRRRDLPDAFEVHFDDRPFADLGLSDILADGVQPATVLDHYGRLYLASTTPQPDDGIEYDYGDPVAWVAHDAIHWTDPSARPPIEKATGAIEATLEALLEDRHPFADLEVTATEYGREWGLHPPKPTQERWRFTPLLDGRYWHLIGILTWEIDPRLLDWIDALAAVVRLRTWGPGLTKPLSEEPSTSLTETREVDDEPA